MAVAAMSVLAQNATNSPYSQYGYGTLAEQGNGASVGMSGLSQGWREGNSVNFANPASYSGIDSLSFIFDAGISGIMTNFTEGSRRLNAYNSSFDYLVGAFRLFPRVGFAFGFMPYSNVGYSYSSEETIGTSELTGDTKTTAVDSYSGSGGIHQIFIGVGASVIKTRSINFSLGVNAAYLWGNYDKAVISSFSDVYINTLSEYYKAKFNSYKVDVALQWGQKITSRDRLTIGGTYSFGHDMKANPECLIISNNSQTLVSDTTSFSAGKYMALPTTIAAGFVWNHANKWRVGVDWLYEMWSKVDYPMKRVLKDENDQEYTVYEMEGGHFKDRHRFIIGGEYCHNELSRRWVDRLRYRIGFSYATPYLLLEEKDGEGNAVYNIDGEIKMRNGPKEYGVSAGVGIPIINGYNNRSVLNVSVSWTRSDAPNMIKEDMFRLSIGLTFNERWFAKWQVE